MLSQPQRRSIWGWVLSTPQIPRPSREGLGMTVWQLFSSAVVLVATSMKDSDERSEEESGMGYPAAPNSLLRSE